MNMVSPFDRTMMRLQHSNGVSLATIASRYGLTREQVRPLLAAITARELLELESRLDGFEARKREP